MAKKAYSNIDIVIPCHVAWCDDAEMIWDVKLCYGLIRGMCRNDYYCCYASNEYLAEQLRKTERTVRRFLEILERKGFIYRTDTYIIDKFDKIMFTRAIVPTDLKRQFEKKKDMMLDLKGSLKNAPRAEINCHPRADKNVHQIYKDIHIEKNITSTNTKIGINPQPPCQGGNNAVTSVETEPFEVLGNFGNVRLTQSQRAAFKGEFGDDMLSVLIEQLDAWIQSSSRRKKRFLKASCDEFYATLRDWALRRIERQRPATTGRLIVGDEIARREYSDTDINGLFTPLDADSP